MVNEHEGLHAFVNWCITEYYMVKDPDKQWGLVIACSECTQRYLDITDEVVDPHVLTRRTSELLSEFLARLTIENAKSPRLVELLVESARDYPLRRNGSTP